MTDLSWESLPTEPPSSTPCSKCQASPREQHVFRGPTGPAWRCKRCHALTVMALPFDPRVPPDGRQQSFEALETLAIFAPVMYPIDRELIYDIVRPYFVAGWTVHDIVHAMDNMPDGQPYTAQGFAWIRGEVRDRTLARLQRRLRAWRWADRDKGEDIMAGPHSSMVRTMAQRRAEQNARASVRAADWATAEIHARQGASSPARAEARKIAAQAAERAGRERRVADLRERSARKRDAAERRAVSDAYQALLNGHKQPTDDEIPWPAGQGPMD